MTRDETNQLIELIEKNRYNTLYCASVLLIIHIIFTISSNTYMKAIKLRTSSELIYLIIKIISSITTFTFNLQNIELRAWHVQIFNFKKSEEIIKNKNKLSISDHSHSAFAGSEEGGLKIVQPRVRKRAHSFNLKISLVQFQFVYE